MYSDMIKEKKLKVIEEIEEKWKEGKKLCKIICEMRMVFIEQPNYACTKALGSTHT